MRKWIVCILLSLGGVACTRTLPSDTPRIAVSIEPLRYLVEQIAGDDFEIDVLVPPGSGPETYEPTPAQMRRLAESGLYFQIGLIDFEQRIARSIDENMPQTTIIRLADGIPLIEGSCGHDDHRELHHRGIDPHIWSSPKSLKIMAKTIYNALAARYPDSLKYGQNISTLLARLDSLDGQLSALFAEGNRHFMIYHPALTYLARDYGLTQIALEEEGKESSAGQIRRMIDTARRWRLKRVLYQKQFSRSTVEALARELEIDAVAIDPLGFNIEYNLFEISLLIANP